MPHTVASQDLFNLRYYTRNKYPIDGALLPGTSGVESPGSYISYSYFKDDQGKVIAHEALSSNFYNRLYRDGPVPLYDNFVGSISGLTTADLSGIPPSPLLWDVVSGNWELFNGNLYCKSSTGKIIFKNHYPDPDDVGFMYATISFGGTSKTLVTVNEDISCSGMVVYSNGYFIGRNSFSIYNTNNISSVWNPNIGGYRYDKSGTFGSDPTRITFDVLENDGNFYIGDINYINSKFHTSVKYIPVGYQVTYSQTEKCQDDPCTVFSCSDIAYTIISNGTSGLTLIGDYEICDGDNIIKVEPNSIADIPDIKLYPCSENLKYQLCCYASLTSGTMTCDIIPYDPAIETPICGEGTCFNCFSDSFCSGIGNFGNCLNFNKGFVGSPGGSGCNQSATYLMPRTTLGDGIANGVGYDWGVGPGPQTACSDYVHRWNGFLKSDANLGKPIRFSCYFGDINDRGVVYPHPDVPYTYARYKNGSECYDVDVNGYVFPCVSGIYNFKTHRLEDPWIEFHAPVNHTIARNITYNKCNRTFTIPSSGISVAYNGKPYQLFPSGTSYTLPNNTISNWGNWWLYIDDSFDLQFTQSDYRPTMEYPLYNVFISGVVTASPVVDNSYQQNYYTHYFKSPIDVETQQGYHLPGFISGYVPTIEYIERDSEKGNDLLRAYNESGKIKIYSKIGRAPLDYEPYYINNKIVDINEKRIYRQDTPLRECNEDIYYKLSRTYISGVIQPYEKVIGLYANDSIKAFARPQRTLPINVRDYGTLSLKESGSFATIETWLPLVKVKWSGSFSIEDYIIDNIYKDEYRGFEQPYKIVPQNHLPKMDTPPPVASAAHDPSYYLSPTYRLLSKTSPNYVYINNVEYDISTMDLSYTFSNFYYQLDSNCQQKPQAWYLYLDDSCQLQAISGHFGISVGDTPFYSGILYNGYQFIKKIYISPIDTITEIGIDNVDINRQYREYHSKDITLYKFPECNPEWVLPYEGSWCLYPSALIASPIFI